VTQLDSLIPKLTQLRILSCL